MDVVLGVGGAFDSITQGGDGGFQVGELGVVLVHVLLEETHVLGEGVDSVVFSFSFQIEGLVQLVLEVVDELDDSADQLVVLGGLGSGGQLSEELNGSGEGLDVVHFAGFVGSLGEVLGDLSHDLRGNVDGFGFSGL